MPRRPRPQPFHEPIGLSPEAHPTSRRWIVTLAAAVVVLAAGLVTWVIASNAF